MTETAKAFAGIVIVAGMVALGIFAMTLKYDACRAEGFGHTYCAFWIAR